MDGSTYIISLAAGIWTGTDLILKCRDRINKRRDDVLGFAKDSRHLSIRARRYILRKEIFEDMVIVNLLLVTYSALLFVSAKAVELDILASFTRVLGVAAGVGAIVSIIVSWLRYSEWRNSIEIGQDSWLADQRTEQ